MFPFNKNLKMSWRQPSFPHVIFVLDPKIIFNLCFLFVFCTHTMKILLKFIPGGLYLLVNSYPPTYVSHF